MSYIIYWMESSQRSRYNHALEKSIKLSNNKNLPLYIINYNLFPKRLKRKSDFIKQGFLDLYFNLKKREISSMFLETKDNLLFLKILKDSAYIITEKSYLKESISKKNKLLKDFKNKVTYVENETVIPVTYISNKEEYSARTLRLKYNKIKDSYIVPFEHIPYIVQKKIPFLEKLCIYDKVKKVALPGGFLGGENEALINLDYFIKNKVKDYSKRPMSLNGTSKLSPYLACGQISPLEIALKINHPDFLEELLIRRELSYNFINYNKKYNKWEGITYEWAYNTLNIHKADKREYLYTRKQLENYETHDKYWNFAQKSIVETGFLHGYLRMYWCKKILQWSPCAEEAYKIALYLNNKYFYDGDTPNSYCGVAWCFGKHDRAWKEREIFGKIRYMNQSGLLKKFEKLGD